MLQNTIDNLPELLKDCICTLCNTAKDTSNKESMCSSLIKVVNFDRIAKRYSAQMKLKKMPTSVDALYVDSKQKWFLIEFKNGSVDSVNIYRKAYDSSIILSNLFTHIDFEFIRKNVIFILVYKPEKCKAQPRIKPCPARDKTMRYIQERAQTETVLFYFDKLEDYLFKEIHTYPLDVFEQKFIKVKEAEEKQEKYATDNPTGTIRVCDG